MRRLAVLLMSFAASFATPGCSSPTRTVPDAASLGGQAVLAYQRASAALDSGEPAVALEEIAPAAEVVPWHVPSHQIRQDALVALGQEAEARRWYEGEAAAHPGDVARALLSARLVPRRDGAREKAYRAVLERDPKSPWPQVALAYELARRASEDFVEATDLADGGFTARSSDALQRGDAAAAEAEALAAGVASSHASLAAAHAVLCDVLLSGREGARSGRGAIALKHAEEASRLEPVSASSWARLARARRAVADDEGAASAFRNAIELAPRDAGLRAGLGRVLLDLRKDGEARDALDDAAALAPTDAVVALNQGVACFRTGDLEGAAAAFTRASGIAPLDPRPLEGLALTRAEMGDREGAAAAMEQYLAVAGADRGAAQRFIDDMRGAAPSIP